MFEKEFEDMTKEEKDEWVQKEINPLTDILTRMQQSLQYLVSKLDNYDFGYCGISDNFFNIVQERSVLGVINQTLELIKQNTWSLETLKQLATCVIHLAESACHLEVFKYNKLLYRHLFYQLLEKNRLSRMRLFEGFNSHDVELILESAKNLKESTEAFKEYVENMCKE